MSAFDTWRILVLLRAVGTISHAASPDAVVAPLTAARQIAR